MAPEMNTNLGPLRDPPLPRPPPLPRSSRANTWLIVAAAAAGALFLGLVACGGLLYLGATGISRRAPNDEERQAVVTIRDLEPLGARVAHQDQREVWLAKRNFDGSLEISYEYDPDRAPGKGHEFTVRSSVEIDPSESSARETYGLTIGAYDLGLRVGGAQSRQLPHTMAGADQSHFALILKNDHPVGNMAVVRQDKRVHGLLITGLYFDDPRQLESLLRPTVTRSGVLSLR
jgi:hypothetical protein